jgi:hypothetical protein
MFDVVSSPNSVGSPSSSIPAPSAKSMFNRTKVQSHAAFIADSITVLGEGLQAACTFSSDFKAAMGLTSFLSLINGTVNVLDGNERFWKRVKVGYLWGAGTSAIRVTKGISDLAYAGFSSVSSVNSVCQTHGVTTVFKTHAVALSTIMDVVKFTYIASSFLAFVMYLGDSINSMNAMSKMAYATTGLELLTSFGITDGVSDDKIETVRLWLSDGCEIKLSKEKLLGIKDLPLDKFKELKADMWKKASYKFYTNFVYTVLSGMNLAVSVADKATLGMFGPIFGLILMVSRGASFIFLDCPRVYHASVKDAGQHDEMVHALITGIVLAISVAGFAAASTASCGVVPLVCMVLTILIPLVADILIHIKNNPALKAYYEEEWKKFNASCDEYLGVAQEVEEKTPATPPQTSRPSSGSTVGFSPDQRTGSSNSLSSDSDSTASSQTLDRTSPVDAPSFSSKQELEEAIRQLSAEEIQQLETLKRVLRF